MTNIVILVGNLGADPQSRTTTTGGVEVATFNLGTSRVKRDSEGRTYKDESGFTAKDTEWHRVTCFNGLGRVVAQHSRKGMLVSVRGRLHNIRWTDAENRRNRDWRSDGAMDGMVIVEEDVQARLGDAIGYAADVLAHVDSTERLTHLAIAVGFADAEYRAWRTRAQHAASSGSIEVGHAYSHEQLPVSVSVRRSALRLGRTDLIEDLVVPLRRRFPAG